MSRINLDNYEAWFLDFFEGRLDVAQIDELFQFLERNPKLKAELKDFEIIPIQPESIDFDEKAILKGEADSLLEDPNLKLTPNQNIKFDAKHLLKQPAVSEEDIFSLTEGEITGLQAEELKSIIVKDNTLYHSFLAYQNAHLVPDKSIIYPHKAQLKKGAAVIPLFMRYASAAAVISG
jgi:mRNA-degrading endonuclease YafQ of YafQ-DinJ toxin-antitoxin module